MIKGESAVHLAECAKNLGLKYTASKIESEGFVKQEWVTWMVRWAKAEKKQNLLDKIHHISTIGSRG